MSLYDITNGVNLIPSPENLDPFVIPYQINLEANHLAIIPNDDITHQLELDVTGNLLLNGTQFKMNNLVNGSISFQIDPATTGNVQLLLPTNNPIGPYQGWLTDATGRLQWDTFYQTFENQLDVTKNPNPLQYATITDALASIGFSDPNVPTAIFVHPGEYQEVNTLTIPSNVYVIGIGMQPVVVMPGWVSPERPMFQLSGGLNGIAFVSIAGGSGNAFAVELNDSGDYATLFKVDVVDWKNCFHCNVTNVESFVYFEYCSTNFDDINIGNTSLYAENYSNFRLSVSCENGFFFGPCNNHCDFRGNNVEFLYSASTIQNTDEFTNFPYGNGVFGLDGCEITMRGIYIEGSNEAILIPNNSVAPNIDLLMSAVLFHNNGNNIQILSANVEGDFTGYSEYEKTNILKESGFFISNQDNNIVTVAKKGGNFTSIKAAVDWIKNVKNPSSTNPFDINVGPGTFVEDTIVLAPYISITGENKFTSSIVPNVNTSTVIVGNVLSSIQGLTLAGATGVGGTLVEYNGSLLSTNSFRMEDMYFGSAETLVKLSSNSGLCSFSSIQTIIASSAIFKEGIVITGTTYPLRSIMSQVSWFTASNNATFSNFVTATSSATSSRDRAYFSQLFGGSDSVSLGGTGMVISGSMGLALQGGALAGFSNGIVVPSGFTYNPNITVGGFQILNTANYELFINGPNTTGFFNISLNEKDIFVTPSAPNIALVVGSAQGDLTIASKLFQGPNVETVTWVSPQWQRSGVTGLYSGTLSSTFSTRTVSISAGSGYVAINTASIDNQTIKYVSWTSTLSVVLPASTGDYYVYVDNAATLNQSLTEPMLSENLLIGRARVEEVSPAVFEIVWILDETVKAVNPLTQLNNAFRDLASPLVTTGVTVSATGVGTNVNITSGTLYWGNQLISPSQLLSPNFIAYTEQMTSANAVGINYTSGIPRVWSNVGNVTNLTNSEWVKHSLYLSGQGSFQQTYLVLGSNVYTTSNDAVNNSAPFAPAFINEAIFQLADVVISGNANVALTSNFIVDQRPFLAVSGTGSSSSSPSTLDHNALLNLAVGDVHTQYLPANGSRPMTGTLDMGTNPITNAGTYNSVNVQAHASRHQPGGADPLLTNTAITITDFTNAEGVSSFLTRSDHTHAHGVRGGGNLHAVANASSNGFMSAADKVIFDAATNLAIANTLAKRDATGQIQFSNVQLLNSSNVITNLVPSSAAAANFSFIFPSDVGSVGQILTSNGVSGTTWTNNSVFIDPTSNVGDMIVRGNANLQALFVPLPNTAPAGANLQYSLVTDFSRFPTWSPFPYNPQSCFVEIDDFTGANVPYAEHNYRVVIGSSATIQTAFPATNPGDPVGCIRLTVPTTNDNVLVTKSSPTVASTLQLSSASTVFFEIAIHADAIDQLNTTLEMGFGNAITTTAPTQMIGFFVPGSGTANIPIQAIVRNTTQTTETIFTASPNQWYTFKFILYGLTVLETYVNDALVPNTLNLTLIPTSTLSPFIRFARGGTGASRNVHVDFIRWGKYWPSNVQVRP